MALIFPEDLAPGEAIPCGARLVRYSDLSAAERISAHEREVRQWSARGGRHSADLIAHHREQIDYLQQLIATGQKAGWPTGWLRSKPAEAAREVPQ